MHGVDAGRYKTSRILPTRLMRLCPDTGRHVLTADGDHRCHSAAFSGAPPACFRTLLAMVHLMLCTFLAAGVANVGARIADQCREFTAARHEPGGVPANLRTINVELDTARQHFYIVFRQTGYGAVVACGSACITFIDTGLKLRLDHGSLLE